ncbi:hypothetical protein PLESTB_001801100 [Pleodorina starrii]|uniref:Radical SAM core domain-containing protein n=1 Tax=Pleodorina starrii TaxID=330485 RepID=A0A9W6FAG2_9CHLO|nr:hypothetical protein PLESTM_001928500 [Pleodorina starrii]GLC61770.1 hypothetical protein PLESTB_001801100 [Pleodorina starrii]GLC67929.1 hypothetical protein PLESTF_000624000 [Pleodorina starrii]
MQNALVRSRFRATVSEGRWKTQRHRKDARFVKFIASQNFVAHAAAVEAALYEESAPSTSGAPRVSGAATLSLSSAAVTAALSALDVPLSFSHRPGLRDAGGRLMLKNLTLPELEEWCLSVGESTKRAKQLYRWLYGNRKWIRNLDQADGDPQAFSAAFKSKVASGASLEGGMQLQSVHTARDGTRKLVFALLGGEAGGPATATRGTVETVLIPMTNRSGQNLRYTACLSTQVGCAMNCQFCYTGRMGLLGNLTTAQIVEQVVEARRFLAEQSVPIPIANIVFMGMGEPLHNYDAVMAAIEILATGLELSRNKIIVSTVGLVPELRRFVASRVAKLAVSLHATTDEVRDWIVPTNRRYPLDELLGALREAFPYDKRKGDDFVVIEYVLLSGVNDSLQDAQRLLHLTADIYCLVNLIVFNPHQGTQFSRSTDEAVRAFRGVFLSAGRPCTVRTSKGDDEMAACGQLGDVNLTARPAPLLKPPEELAAKLAAAAVAAAPTAAAAGCSCD